MPISLGAEPHMVALANQADAANRPRWIIVVAASLAIICAVIATAGTMRLMRARTSYATAEAQLIRAGALTEQIFTTRTAKPSLATLYPDAGLMYNQVLAAMTSTWGIERNGSVASFATVQDLKRDALSIPGLGKANVRVSIRNQPLETILQFVEATLTNDSMRNAFVSTFELEPAAAGWNAVIEFRRYEVR